MNRRGFLLGKFLPLHNGHAYMIDFARAYCDHLTIYVGTRSDEPISGKLRAAWMRKMYPDCYVIHVENDDLPSHPPTDAEGIKKFRKTWIDEVQRTQSSFGSYEFVFASEDYGKWVAEGIGAQFVPVDPKRTAIPISGTDIRFDPYAYWNYLPEVVRAHYTKRICLFGPESTGKSTLVKHLVNHYKTIGVPEYGRTYTEMFGSEITKKDMANIFAGHNASTKALLPKANRFMICDTDPILSTVWSDVLTGGHDAIFDEYNDPCDYYLLTSPDLEWVNDGTRYTALSDQEKRWDFFNRCEAELKRRNLPYGIVKGKGYDRLLCAIYNINQHFPNITLEDQLTRAETLTEYYSHGRPF